MDDHLLSPLQERAAELGIPCYVIGDALQARRAIQAIQEATDVAMAIDWPNRYRLPPLHRSAPGAVRTL